MSESTLSRSASGPFLEAAPDELVITSEADVTTLLEACFGAGVRRVLLHSANFSPTFFDLSSREAGMILQKLRNYGVRLAILCAADLHASRRFTEVVTEENRGRHVRFFQAADRVAAVDWLADERV